MFRTMSVKPPTNLEYALLGLLHQVPQSGYDLRKIFATTAMGNYSSSPGAIYPALKRLETKGLIEGTIDDAKELRPRKIFSPSDQGKAVFRMWLQEGIGDADIGRQLDVLMLRLAFHSVLDDLGATRRFVAELAERLERNLESLTAQRKLFPEQTPIQPRLAFDFGITQARAAVRWAHKALKQLETTDS
jgi:DNA-binding PadR family transcriptional regulator